jgi:CRISPR-associated endoribonuclease Cas6
VRSVQKEFIKRVEEGIKIHGLKIGDSVLRPEKISCEDYQITESRIEIEMLSPITVSSTNADKYRRYFNPLDKEFYELVLANFKRKYCAFSGENPESQVIFKNMLISTKDKRVTKYRGGIILSWKGNYQLIGDLKYLNFLYNTGLGSKNSQGFGMFKVLRQGGRNE